MTITQLQYVLAVAEHKNFTLAAEKCFVTQPTLSMQIQKVEEELNIQIFDRSKKPIQLTEIGQKIVFLKNGLLEWEGSNKEIFKTDNEAVTDFVYSSELFKRVRKMYLEDDVK